MEFALNGDKVTVAAAKASAMTLNEFIRTKTIFKGTKLSCAQGGCGACTVAVSYKDDAGTLQTKTLPSCLVPLVSVHRCSVTTVEGLKKAACGEDGNGGHPVQERMVQFQGTQCGFCTPGMVMQMWGGLTQHNTNGGKNISCDLLEDLDLMAGNLCRCTGYRPISDCLKSFANDAKAKVVDNVFNGPVGSYDTKLNDPKFPSFLDEENADASEECKGWARPKTMEALLAAWAPAKKVISGHTGWGVYKELCALRLTGKEDSVIQIDAVPELKQVTVTDSRMVIGTSTKLSDFAAKLGEVKGPTSSACTNIQKHVLLIAGYQVRNAGSVGGNLMMVKNEGFASDLATLLCAADGIATFLNASKKEQKMPLIDFLHAGKEEVLLLSISIKIDGEFVSYRSAIRPRNAYSLINAAMAYDSKDGVVSNLKIVYGAVGKAPIAAKALVEKMKGVNLYANRESGVAPNVRTLLIEVFEAMNDDHHKEYRTRVAQAFALRFAKCLSGSEAPEGIHGKGLRHTTTHQTFDLPKDSESKSLAPAFEPKVKTTALAQTTGDSRFTEDEVVPQLTLHAAYVQIPYANYTFAGLDTSLAKDALGSELFTVLEAKDLDKGMRIDWMSDPMLPPMPGREPPEGFANEYIFLPSGTKSLYGGQPVGVVLASTRQLALLAAKLVKLKDLKTAGKVYTDPSEAPVLSGVKPFNFTRGDKKKTEAAFQDTPAGKTVVSGKFEKKSQANFYLENQSSVAVPDEDGGLVLTMCCQDTNFIRKIVAKYLGISQANFIVNTRRLGGAFGGKYTRGLPPALVACIAARKVNRPISFVLPKEVDMAIGAGRQELKSTFSAVVDQKTGAIEALRANFDFAQGATMDAAEIHIMLMGQNLDMVYKLDQVDLVFNIKQTHDGPSTAVRAPGHFEAVMFIETVMDTIAGHLGLSPERIREVNFHPHRKLLATQGIGGGILPPALVEGNTLIPLWNKLVKDSKFVERKKKIDEFNSKNALRKRGIAIAPAKYGMLRFGNHAARMDVLADGSLQLITNGIEMGQGIHTKIAQVALGTLNKKLGVRVPLTNVRFANQNSHVLSLGGGTGGSTTSEQTSFAMEEAAVKMAEKLAPFLKLAKKIAAEKKKSSFDWQDLVKAGFKGNTPFWNPDFSTMGFYRPEIKDLTYDTYGACVSEVEIDVLTGESKVLFTQVMFDCAPCLNPAVDIGQIEGAYVMGLGQMLLEQRLHDPTNGQLLSTNTWTYKPPTISDIPENFVVNIVDLRSQETNNGWDWVLGGLGSTLPALGLFHKSYTKGSRAFKSSRATGEPPVLFSYAILSALRNAVLATGRQDPKKIVMPIPCTPEEVAGLTWAGAKDVNEVLGTESKAVVKDEYVPGNKPVSPGMSVALPLVILTTVVVGGYIYFSTTSSSSI